jgi:hypothetical protein
MKSLCRVIVSVCLAINTSAMAYTFGTPITVSGLRWTLSAVPGATANCNDLDLDFIGDFAHSTKFSQYGAFNCGTIVSFPASGSGYLDATNHLNFTMTVGLASIWQCIVSAASLVGTCFLLDGTTGAQVGTVFLTPR